MNIVCLFVEHIVKVLQMLMTKYIIHIQMIIVAFHDLLLYKMTFQFPMLTFFFSFTKYFGV